MRPYYQNSFFSKFFFVPHLKLQNIFKHVQIVSQIAQCQKLDGNQIYLAKWTLIYGLRHHFYLTLTHILFYRVMYWGVNSRWKWIELRHRHVVERRVSVQMLLWFITVKRELKITIKKLILLASAYDFKRGAHQGGGQHQWKGWHYGAGWHWLGDLQEIKVKDGQAKIKIWVLPGAF